MESKELLDSGRLEEALEQTADRLRKKPAHVHLRTLLFELLCFQADFARAEKQLDVVANSSGDVKMELAVQVYKNVLASERVRQSVFEGDALPKLLLEPPEYVDRYVVLLKKTRQADGLAQWVEEAEESFPEFSGRLDGKPFQSLRDGDDRLAPILEVLHGSDYLWVPFGQIRKIEIEEPRKLRDLIWIRARVETVGEPLGDVFLPVLYPGSAAHRDQNVRLGRLTDWQSRHDVMVIGQGRHNWLVDGREVPLPSVRRVEFDSPKGAREMEESQQ